MPARALIMPSRTAIRCPRASLLLLGGLGHVAFGASEVLGHLGTWADVLPFLR